MCARWVGLVAALCLLHTEACTARDLPARRRLIIKGEEVASRDRWELEQLAGVRPLQFPSQGQRASSEGC